MSPARPTRRSPLSRRLKAWAAPAVERLEERVLMDIGGGGNVLFPGHRRPRLRR